MRAFSDQRRFVVSVIQKEIKLKVPPKLIVTSQEVQKFFNNPFFQKKTLFIIISDITSPKTKPIRVTI